MKIIVADKAGFCFGVKRAIDMANDVVRKRDGPIYSLGPLIHNPQVVDKLAQEGIIAIDDLKEIHAGTVIIRSHGVGPEILSEVYERGLNLINATCPFVSRAQQIARDLYTEGRQVIVVGDKDHPEVQGIVGWANGQALVVQNSLEAEALGAISNAGVLAQTTQPLVNFQQVVDVLKQKTEQLKECNTICHATGERQQAALELARNVDVMVVVGGANSANTGKLANLCRSTGTPAYQIETAGELRVGWFACVEKVGLTAGASTPDWIIEEVKKRMNELGEMNGIEESKEQLEEINSAEEGMQDSVEVKALHNGDIVKGVVVQIGQDEVLVDVGSKSEGFISAKELSSFNINSPDEVVKIGDEIDVFVISAEDNEGRIKLSKTRADAENAWAKLESLLESSEKIEGTVREVVKGGLLVDVGVRAFLPASLVDKGYVEDLSKYVGENITAQVIEINRIRRKVVLSRKAILEEEYANRKEELLNSLQEGQTVSGIVRRITNFGAFVDIGGVDGLLHISEMAWYRVTHPSEIVQVGDEVTVMVLKIDRNADKISLGLKQVLANPWENVDSKYPVGAIVAAKVVRLAPFGAFVQLEPGVEGLVHISHLADHHVEKPEDVVSEGEEVNVKVLSVDTQEKRIRLSIKEVTKKVKEEKPVQNYESNSQGSGEITIGEILGASLKK
ncbi:hydroxymethylbutenyl pyrophosphate reductase [Desulfofarcimen acetoxidans DSM 771]|jgi:4-hydroxy-3-methylbut-2-enyl diphosphate reductase|uniref:4-hydroxy-3-methylbut-2-enyl diphosphate reductase n=1 Tax=Desulfofarcimen acetoxidans (strain ATCC 49208 / DSM 771 / KCTC 5769 / VKM B-1644 / 5575) TaxID=485916 RepID=C8VZ21_DESAS|nr:bifunctional 4-hydroxy-3-methylbut-2-enyl diphosphate reductase/30S ribosomal protein S1 [Desulfofarcimen acetoxidans]ACV62931.1 hydroxymethylbutenyl pyrophosphate reductase [Desulfofarcimen acetoxidans DSM 771]